MATLGKMEEYCPSTEKWPQYIKHLEFFSLQTKSQIHIEKGYTFVSDGTSNI